MTKGQVPTGPDSPDGRDRSARGDDAARRLRLRLRLMRRLVVVAAATLLAWSSLAIAAEEITRTQYTAQVEPICKRNAEANAQILKGVRTKVRQGKLRPAGRQLVKAAAALRKTLVQLEAVPRPAADEARLTEWLKRVNDEAALLQQAGKALEAGQKRRAETLQARLYSGARLTNAIVAAFGFHYCRFEPSKYT